MKKIKSIASFMLALTLIVVPSFSSLAGSVRSDLKPVKKEEPKKTEPEKQEQKAEQAQAQTQAVQEQTQAQEQTQQVQQAQTQSDPQTYAPILFKPE